MDTTKISPSAPQQEPAVFGHEDRDRIHAFLQNQQVLPGTTFNPHIKWRIDRGRKAVGQLAFGRRVTLEREECADVLCFLQCTAPIELLNPASRESPDPYCGFLNVVEVLEKSLRAELTQAAAAIHGATAAVEAMFEDAESDSDEDRRRIEAVQHLNEALALVEWKAPVEEEALLSKPWITSP